MSQVEEIDGYRYYVVRLSEIAELNRLVEQLLDTAEQLPFLRENDDFYETLAWGYDEYVRGLVGRRFGVDAVCLDEGVPEDCEAYITTVEPGSILVDPEVWIREDKYRG